jgi:ribosomal subunit interface protein
MHLYVTARHFDLTPAIREYVERRLLQPVQAHATAHDLVRMEVQLTQFDASSARYRCHVLLQLPGHHDLNVSEETMDLYEAIDRAEKRLVRHLVDERQRMKTEQRHANDRN